MGDRLKKIAKLGFAIISCFLLIGGLTSIVMGDSEKPDWKVGDEWKYDMTVMGMNVKVTHKVSEITNINVNGTDYEVFHIEVIGSGGTKHMYYTKSDLSLVKMEVPSTAVSSSFTITYDPPKKEFDFPLVVGKTWNSTYTETIHSDEYGLINVTGTEYYSVVEIESITIKAGTFECYRIESHDDHGFINTTRWYSEDVKYFIKSSEKVNEVTTELELISYTFDGKGEGSAPPALPDLILLVIIPLIILAFVVGVAVSRKRKKAKEARAKNSTSELTPTATQPSHPASKTTLLQPSSTTTKLPPQKYIPPPPPPRKPPSSH